MCSSDLNGARQEVEILDQKGPVEPHELSEARDLRGAALGREKQRRGIAGKPDQEEHHHRNTEDDGDGVDSSRREVAKHPYLISARRKSTIVSPRGVQAMRLLTT